MATIDEGTRELDLRGAGVRLRADVVGPDAGPPAVLLHGGGQTRHSWGTTARALAADGWRAYTVDLRGHGRSEWAEDGDYSLDAFASDVSALARSFEQSPVLVGASLGGIASLVAVGEHAERGAELAAALVMVDVAPRIEQTGSDRIGAFMTARLEEGYESLEEVADAIATYNPHRPRPSDLSGLRKNLRQRPDGRWVWHWDPRFVTWRSQADVPRSSGLIDPDRLEAAARHVRIPTLLVRGKVSDLLSEEGARALLAIVPHAEYADVEGAGHMVAGDRNDAFNDAVVSFLGRHRPR